MPEIPWGALLYKLFPNIYVNSINYAEFKNINYLNSGGDVGGEDRRDR